MIRVLFILVMTLLIAPAVWAQSASGPPVEEQSEAMIDTLKRMRIKREENEHKKLLEKGAQIADLSAEISRNYAHRTIVSLPREIEKKLRDIEKSAKQIRSESGSSKDEPLESPPASLDEAIARLDKTSQRLNDNLSKTSRHMVSISVIDDANEIIELIRVLKGYIR